MFIYLFFKVFRFYQDKKKRWDDSFVSFFRLLVRE